MSQSVDIHNRESLRNLLLALDTETAPLWGKMKPQQMVEHLVNQIEWTNGKRIATCDRAPDEAEKRKQVMIYTDAEIPQNIFLETLSENYRFNSISEAIDQLMTELDDFDHYFKIPGTVAIHGGFGPMTYNEWVLWHGKHFAHHLKQFGLIY